MKFWDSSAVVPLIVQEPTTSAMLKLYEEDPIVCVWWATDLECASALSRYEREGKLSHEAVGEALSTLLELQGSWHEIQAQNAVRETARRLLRTHPLRVGDALQLAAAWVASDNRPISLPFVTLDERLRLVAEREGFVVCAI